MRLRLSRRALLRGVASTAAAWPLAHLFGRVSRARASGMAERLIVFYFPDGIAGRSAEGEPNLFDAHGTSGAPMLSEILAPLAPYASRTVFLNGLSMGPADEGSHPGGAKKLLTATDGGYGESLDQLLARTVGATSLHRHLYLGAQANADHASGDKHISYPSAGITTPPEDDPVLAFGRLFGSGVVAPPGEEPNLVDRSILDTASADLEELRGRVRGSERVKLDLHMDALREVELRLAAMTMTMGTCEAPTLGLPSLDAAGLYAPENFGPLLAAQTELMVTAMACGLSRVGVLQCSHHTSELIMSRIMGSAMYDPGYDMRSHQASHYGARHDFTNRLFSSYVQQRTWWVDRFRALLAALDARPEGDGTMLDHSLVLLCSEVSDGNTHLHGDMPFVLAGGGGGCIPGGRVIDTAGRRHAELLCALAQAMGASVDRFGDTGSGPLPGLLV